jgi:hypothetical protein
MGSEHRSSTSANLVRLSAPSPSRRALLGGFVALAAMGLGRLARAETAPTSRILRTTSDARGVTLVLELEHAPFPAPGSGYHDATVIVFVPRHYRASTDAGVAMVVHYHGHNTTAERAVLGHQLREQLYESKQNAILVVPQLAVLQPDSAAGKLEQPGAFARMLADVARTMDTAAARAALGSAALPAGAVAGRVCVSAHSGGFHAAACSLKHGGLAVREAYLFDALYADVETFKDWVVAGRGQPMGSRHKLVSYYTGGTTEANTVRLFSELERAGVSCAHEQIEGTLSRSELTQSEAVAIRTQLGHGAVTSELNGLRDCLYASALRRHLRSSWFDARDARRPLERRRRE